MNSSRGGTQKFVSLKVLRGLKIPLPPLPEQKRIAKILDAVDALRAKRRESIALLDTFLQSTFLKMFGDPVTNPMEWESAILSDLAEFKGGSQPPKSTFTFEPGPDRIRLVQIRDFKTDKFATYIPSNLARRKFDEQDVMIARYGPPVFQILRGMSGSYNVALMKAVPKESVLHEFLFYLLSSHQINKAVVAQSERTAGQSGVNLQFLNSFSAYKPPLSLQIKFSEICERTRGLHNSMIRSKNESANLFDCLQQRAFNGEL